MGVLGLNEVWGLHFADAAIVIAFLVAVLIVGVRVSRGVKHESDFYLGGRKLGRALQFFLQFGNSTDAAGAGQLSSEVYRQGMAGIWLNFQALFITPFFWFTQVWFRRARVTTMADLFVDRFDSRALAKWYAAFNVIVALLTLGLGNLVGYKVTAAMMIKPESEWTAPERRQIEDFHEYQSLGKLRNGETITHDQLKRWEELDNRSTRGELQSTISYIKPIPFFIVYSTIVATYIALGGLKAAAITDAIQGLLIVAMSVLLIPVGLSAVGGISGLHAKVPEYKFYLASTVRATDYTWYSIAAITFTSLVQVFGLMHNMGLAGSAKDEDTARFGMISGAFTKRFVLIAWAFCGLLAVAIFQGSETLSDPDLAWGQLSTKLLPTGLKGLMLAGMLLGHMPAVGVACVSVSGLFTLNVYKEMIKNRSERHYQRVGQISIAAVLVLAILAAMFFTGGVIQLLREVIAFNAYFGAVVFLIFFWRRLTARAILIGLAIWVITIGVIPWTMQFTEFRESPALLVKTPEQHVMVKTGATQEDVDAGRAAKVGVTIEAPYTINSIPCFFEKIARSPEDPNSPLAGIGRFNFETYALYLLSVPVQNFSSAGLVTARWLFDGLFAFALPIFFSLFTRPAERTRIDRFYVKLKTPVAPTPELDVEEVQKGFENPNRFDYERLLPGSNWEFTKWTRKDVLGFSACWALVGFILLLIWAILNLGN